MADPSESWVGWALAFALLLFVGGCSWLAARRSKPSQERDEHEDLAL